MISPHPVDHRDETVLLAVRQYHGLKENSGPAEAAARTIAFWAGTDDATVVAVNAVVASLFTQDADTWAENPDPDRTEAIRSARRLAEERLASVPVEELTSEVAIAVVNDHLQAPDHVLAAVVRTVQAYVRSHGSTGTSGRLGRQWI
jgi:ethanolamine ammonia-lyase small subunit